MVYDRHSSGVGSGSTIGGTTRTALRPEPGMGPGKQTLVEQIPDLRAQLKARGDGRPSKAAPDARRNEALPGPVAAEMGKSLGADLSGVRVHTGDGVADEYGAHAVTVGPDIHFAPGKYDPGDAQGKTLLAHELVHTVQQGASPSTRKPEAAGETGALEHEADVAAADVVSVKPANCPPAARRSARRSPGRRKPTQRIRLHRARTATR
jgi:hypothetical protein